MLPFTTPPLPSQSPATGSVECVPHPQPLSHLFFPFTGTSSALPPPPLRPSRFAHATPSVSAFVCVCMRVWGCAREGVYACMRVNVECMGAVPGDQLANGHWRSSSCQPAYTEKKTKFNYCCLPFCLVFEAIFEAPDPKPKSP